MSSEIKNSLFDAVRRNCITSVKELVHCYGLSYCPEWCGGYELLCIAIDKGHWNLAKFLLGEGARANNSEAVQKLTPLHLAVRKRKLTPLHLAVRKRWNQSLAEMLLEKNANIEAVNRKNQTPLHIAVLQGNYEAVHLLLKKGANVNARDKFYRAPLSIVAEKLRWNGHDDDSFVKASMRAVPNESIYLEIMGILISYGAEVNLVNAKGEALLHLAVKENSLKIVETLIKHGANVNVATKMMSVSSYDYDEDFDESEEFELFIGLIGFNHTKYSSLKDLGLTPLHYSVKQRVVTEDVVNALLKHGADINARSKRNRTPLHYLMLHYGGHIGNMLELFLIHGAEPDAVCSLGLTPLLIAAVSSYHQNVATLLQFGADIDYTGGICLTPLHLASRLSDVKTVKILLEHGADINLRTRSGESAGALAFKSFVGNIKWHMGNDILGEYSWHYSTFSIFKYHCIKCKVVGLHEIAGDWFESPAFDLFRGEEAISLMQFISRCKQEFAKMQDQKVCCHLNVSDILKNRNRHFIRKNEFLSHIMDSLDFEQFPIYGSLLKCPIREGKLWNELLVPACNSLDSLMKTSNQPNGKKLPILPMELKEQIFYFLTSKDLRSLISFNNSEMKLFNGVVNEPAFFKCQQIKEPDPCLLIKYLQI